MRTLWMTPTVALAYARTAGTDEHAASRALLRELLAVVAGGDGATVALEADAAGRPFLAGRTDLAVSLSHEDGWVAAAVAIGVAARVGVDVQPPVPDTGWPMMRKCCGPTEIAELAELSPADRDREFAWLWTVREACVKAEGTGIAGCPWAVPVPVGGRSGTWRDYTWRSLRDTSDVPVSCAYREAAR